VGVANPQSWEEAPTVGSGSVGYIPFERGLASSYRAP